MCKRHYKNADCYPGLKIGTLTLLAPIRIPVNRPPRKTRAGWKCVCDCGKYVEVQTVFFHDHISCGASQHLRSWKGGDRNSGPYHTIYARWQLMLKRCENPKYPAYKDYGGRGIKVCEEWHDYQKFKQWYLDQGFIAPDDPRTTDRIDVNGDYSPENCRLATPLEQGQNKRNSHRVPYNGKLMTPRELYDANKGGEIPSYNTIRRRIYNGESAESALRPARKARVFYLFGDEYTSKEAAMKFSVSRAAIDKWYKKGFSNTEIENKIKKYGKVF